MLKLFPSGRTPALPLAYHAPFPQPTLVDPRRDSPMSRDPQVEQFLRKGFLLLLGVRFGPCFFFFNRVFRNVFFPQVFFLRFSEGFLRLLRFSKGFCGNAVGKRPEGNRQRGDK